MGKQRARQGSLPAAIIIIGLFSGRLISEAVKPQPAGALLITGGVIAILAVLVFLWARRRDLRPGWALPILTLPLLAYIFYPEANWRVALAAGTVALLAALLLWRPAKEKNARLITAAWYVTAGLGLFLLYLATLAPDLLPADNGEFQLVAATLGVAHPPGFPLYTMLAHAMTRLPLGPTPAYRVNLLSAIIAVATLLLVMGMVQKLTRSRPAGLVAALALGTATTFWAQATTANIRSLTAFFAALALFALVNLREQAQQRTPRPGAYLLLGLALGFGLTHHPSLLFMDIIFIITMLLLDPSFLRQPRRWPPLLIGGLLGLLPLFYLPLRAGASVPGASPALATLPGFLDHVLARGFQGDFFAFASPADLIQRLGIMGNVLTFQFRGLLLAGALLGFLWLARGDKKMAFLFGGAFAVHTLITAIYRAPQTVEYMLPAYIPVAVCAGVLVYWFLKPGERSRPVAALAAVGAAVLLVAAVAQGVSGWPSYRLLHDDYTAREYADSLLTPTPAGSAILSDWHWVTPMWYRHRVEGAAPAVEIRYVFPESAPYAQTWASRIQEELATGREVIATHYDPAAYADLPPPEPLAEAFRFPQQPRTQLPDDFTPLDLPLGGALQVSGYRVTPQLAALDGEIVLTLAWQPAGELSTGQEPSWTLYAHLVSQEGQVAAQTDVPAQPRPEGLTLTQIRLAPRPGTAPGEFTLAAGAYQTAGGAPLANPAGEPRTPLATVMLTPQTTPSFTQQPASRVVVSGRPLLQLVGYDWDHTVPGRTRLYRHWRTEAGYQSEVLDTTGEQPAFPAWSGPWGLLREGTALPDRPGQQYVPLGGGIVWTGPAALAGQELSPAEALTLPAVFAASRPVLRDLVVSMRLVGYEPDGFHWAWTDLHDGVPALGAIPTLKWVGGSLVRDPHPLTVSPTATPGQQVGGIVRLYEAFTSRPVPILDETILTNYLGIPLGDAVIVD